MEGVRSRGCQGLVLAALVAGTGCGPQDDPSTEQPLGSAQQGVALQNSLAPYGLISNGLISNGLISNGLISNGLNTAEFTQWFNAEPPRHAEVMSYLVSCALAQGSTLSYTHAATGTTYTWHGSLGLAPGWASGQPATELEQQVTSACLGARVNKFGVSVLISLLGVGAGGTPLPSGAQELGEYPVREGCFFGNLFSPDLPVYVGNDGLALRSDQSTTRVCALTGAGGRSQCESMQHVGSCSQYCTRDAQGVYYVNCSYNGRNYRPMTTRMRMEYIATCGDGVCSVSEGPGMPSACARDCGS